MKKLFLVLMPLVLFSCESAKLNEAVVVEQINVLESGAYKYEVKLHTQSSNSADAFYYTNFRFQVSDTLVSFFEFFEGKNIELKKMTRENDSLKKELAISNYYLQILKDRLVVDIIPKK